MIKLANYWVADEPSVFGFYHLMCILLVAIFTIILCIKFKNPSDKLLNKILLISGILMVVLEIYKELTYMTSYDEQIGKYDYDWYAFPFQFCSTAIYILCLTPFIKPGKFKECLLAFLAIFSLFGGLTVYAYPEQVFVERVGINIQTMVHHGLQVAIGLYLIIGNIVPFTIKSLIKGSYVFLSLVAIAMLLNIVVYHSGITNGETFNMFYISPYYECTLPLVGLFYPVENVGTILYFPFLLLYVIGFILAGGTVFWIVNQLKKLVLRLIENKFKKVQEAR